MVFFLSSGLRTMASDGSSSRLLRFVRGLRHHAAERMRRSGSDSRRCHYAGSGGAFSARQVSARACVRRVACADVDRRLGSIPCFARCGAKSNCAIWAIHRSDRCALGKGDVADAQRRQHSRGFGIKHTRRSDCNQPSLGFGEFVAASVSSGIGFGQFHLAGLAFRHRLCRRRRAERAQYLDARSCSGCCFCPSARIIRRVCVTATKEKRDGNVCAMGGIILSRLCSDDLARE